jgi:hypothetical protein
MATGEIDRGNPDQRSPSHCMATPGGRPITELAAAPTFVTAVSRPGWTEAMCDLPANCLSQSEAEALILELAGREEGLEADAAERLAEVMWVVGVRSEMIHAYVRTGLLVGDGARDVHTAEELRVWDAAIREYFSLVAK